MQIFSLIPPWKIILNISKKSTSFTNVGSQTLWLASCRIHCMLRLKNFYVSKLVKNSGTKLMSFAFSPPFFYFFRSRQNRSVKFESATSIVKCEIWNLIVGWTRYKTELNQSTEVKYFVGQCVLLCLSYVLIYILQRKIKNKSLNFAQSNMHQKTNAGGSFET